MILLSVGLFCGALGFAGGALVSFYTLDGSTEDYIAELENRISKYEAI